MLRLSSISDGETEESVSAEQLAETRTQREFIKEKEQLSVWKAGESPEALAGHHFASGFRVGRGVIH